MISAIENNLQKGITLLSSITDAQYSNTSVAPYYSSIGNHIRHVLDIFSCLFKGLETSCVDFSKREKNELAETKTEAGINYFNTIICQLQSLNQKDIETNIIISDDMGCGMESATYTLAAALMQAHSHTVHHFATIGYIIYQLNIKLPDSDFGYNTTTEKKKKAIN